MHSRQRKLECAQQKYSPVSRDRQGMPASGARMSGGISSFICHLMQSLQNLANVWGSSREVVTELVQPFFLLVTTVRFVSDRDLVLE